MFESRWDEGLIGMCPGDKRKLTIPPEYGYGDRDVGPIKGGSTLSMSASPPPFGWLLYLITELCASADMLTFCSLRDRACCH